MRRIFFSMTGFCGSIIVELLGGWDGALQTLILFMVIDWITGGILLPVFFKKSPKSANGTLESRAGWKGLVRKGVTLLCVLVASRIDFLLKTDYLRNTVCIGFIANEAVSIIENVGLMGVPLPECVTEGIDLLKKANS